MSNGERDEGKEERGEATQSENEPLWMGRGRGTEDDAGSSGMTIMSNNALPVSRTLSRALKAMGRVGI